MANLQTTFTSVTLAVLLTLASGYDVYHSVMPRYSHPAPVQNGPIFISSDSLSDAYDRDAPDYHVIGGGLPLGAGGPLVGGAPLVGGYYGGYDMDAPDNMIIQVGGGYGAAAPRVVGGGLGGGVAKVARVVGGLADQVLGGYRLGGGLGGGLARVARVIDLDYPLQSVTGYRSARRSSSPRRLSSPVRSGRKLRLSRPYSRNGKQVMRFRV